MSARDSRWGELLDLALPALDYVFGPVRDGVVRPDWTLGGGTAIALRIGHRISYDIDVFVPGIALRQFTPAHNPGARLISPRFQWPGHYLKFERPEGEIDFLSPALQTDPGFAWMDYKGRRIAIETPEEVIVKKMRYRSAKFTARDVYDLAAVSEARPGLETILATEVSDTLARTRENLDRHMRQGQPALEAAVAVTERGAALLPHVFDLARAALDRAVAQVEDMLRHSGRASDGEQGRAP